MVKQLEVFEYRFTSDDGPFESVTIRVRSDSDELAWEEAIALMRAGKVEDMDLDTEHLAG
jgi:hypothetical protein